MFFDLNANSDFASWGLVRENVGDFERGCLASCACLPPYGAVASLSTTTGERCAKAHPTSLLGVPRRTENLDAAKSLIILPA
jgi:hypothetical protein